MKPVVRTLLLSFPLLSFPEREARADYMLAPVQERIVLLLDLKSVRVEGTDLTLKSQEFEGKYAVDKIWMQDRIWSDGICVGIPDQDPRSAVKRLQEVRDALREKKNGSLLVELVLRKGSKEFIVSYLRLFHAEIEFPRYFPKREFYDTIQLPPSLKPKNAAEFAAKLRDSTASGIERLAAKREGLGGR